MKKNYLFALLQVLFFLSFPFWKVGTCAALELPENIPGDYEDKWYGIHCSDVPRKEMVGCSGGEAVSKSNDNKFMGL